MTAGRRKSREKKPDIEADDHLRRLVTFHYNEAAKEADVEPTDQERSDDVDLLIAQVGEGADDAIAGAADMLFIVRAEESDD